MSDDADNPKRRNNRRAVCLVLAALFGIPALALLIGYTAMYGRYQAELDAGELFHGKEALETARAAMAAEFKRSALSLLASSSPGSALRRAIRQAIRRQNSYPVLFAGARAAPRSVRV